MLQASSVDGRRQSDNFPTFLVPAPTAKSYQNLSTVCVHFSVSERIVSTSTLTFFSESRVTSLAAFFTNIHPVYPFLDQPEFVAQATNAYLDDLMRINAPFCALYYAVLALGSTDSDDEDIGCIIPVVPESVFGDYDWFTAAIRLARISSIAYSNLFSAICHFNIIFAIERLAIHVTTDKGNALEGGGTSLASAARTVADLTIIDIEPYVSIFISGILPLSALFILFDDIIHNPLHARTEKNVVLLENTSCYFVSLDYVSAGALPGGIIAEFAGIARRYASNVGQRRFEGTFGQAATMASAEFAADGRVIPGHPLPTYPNTCDNTSQVERDELKALFGTAFPD
ncbi:fungal specific transcription factor [Fusarium heterosporum]|uniref:Fungal specific transcription factor n=1 Tax=Fusarium heterosporum TaxID=42747 RepID=A0A8H5TM94_FUSHE|nr:fungal specific transcription factor [Fusarium heterosporum]